MRSKLDASSLRGLRPGARVWEAGVGYRRNRSGPDGAWYIRYRVPLVFTDQPVAKARTKQLEERLPNCKNKTQALRILEDRRAAVFKATYQPAKDVPVVTLGEFIPMFLAAKRHLKTCRKYGRQLELHLLPYFKDVPLASITKAQCKEYYNARLDAGVAVSTANGELACA